MLPTLSAVGYGAGRPVPRRNLLRHSLESNAYRIATFSFTVSILVLVAVWTVTPRSLYSVPLDAAQAGLPAYRMPEPMSYNDEPQPPNWEYRESAVKQAFLHAYRAYEENAFPADEYWPLSNKPRQNFNGWGVSIVDAMDTMYLMGLNLEFERALVHVSMMNFELAEGKYVHFFETTIRYLGGLLSAYALSKDPILLDKADQLARKLLPVFETPSGLPAFGINPETGRRDGGLDKPRVLLSEIASCQLEFRYLAHLTGEADYYRAVNRVNALLQMSQNRRSDSLWATYWESENGTQTNDHISVGAWSDSAYEYVLKQYLQTSQTEPRFKRMHLRATRGILDTLFYLSPERNLLYVTDTYEGIPTRKFEHLSCFYPGLLALELHALENDTSIPERDRTLHRWAAEGLAHTCWTMYHESESGLGPEVAQFESRFLAGVPKSKAWEERWMSNVWSWEEEGRLAGKPPGVANLAEPIKKEAGVKRDYTTHASPYYLRPETIESIYLMWKMTGDEVWRERGWAIFKAIEQHCRLHVGYASVSSVDTADPYVILNKLDDMPSYALAETWKYLYLLFKDDDPIPLDRWVFNTEAHPLPVFEWNETEKNKFGIP